MAVAKIMPMSGDPKKPSRADQEWAIEQNRQWADEDKSKKKPVDNAHRTTVVGEYARSHSGQNYHAVCTRPDCDWQGRDYGPTAHGAATQEGHRHFLEHYDGPTADPPSRTGAFQEGAKS